MPDLKASMFFTDGVMAQSERLMLRSPEDEDLMKYIDAFGSPNPLLAEEYRRNERLREHYWRDVMESEDSLYCSICDKDSEAFLGYCEVDGLNERPLEIGISLLEDSQAKGFGPEALTAFMAAFQRVSGPMAFTARITAENVSSQKMFRRLGFAPDGIATFIIKDSDSLERLEQARLKKLGGIPEGLQVLAEEFGVEPQKLLSHVLVFKRPAG